MIAGVLAISSSGFVAPLSVRASSSLMASMMDSGATRDPSEQSFDNDMSGWKPPSGGGGGHSLGGEYNPTDTPDFLPEEGSELGAKAAGIAYTDGMMGSRTLPPPVFDQAENTDFPCLPCGWSTRERRVGRVALQFPSSLSSSLMSFCSSSCNVSCLAEHDPNRKKSSGPELAGALESNPDIYVPDKLEVQVDTSDFVLPEPEWRLSKMAMSSTHEVSSRSGECPPLRRAPCGGSSHRLEAVLQDAAETPGMLSRAGVIGNHRPPNGPCPSHPLPFGLLHARRTSSSPAPPRRPRISPSKSPRCA
jgi:hypothetical protein